MPTILLSFFLLVVLASCSVNREAHLYPVNDAAIATGVLVAHFTSNGSGHTSGGGITMPDGEVLTGESSLVRGGSIGFGTIFASVYGPKGSAVGTATSMSTDIPGGSPGMASLFGDRGTAMQCEFYNDNFSGHGYGACRTSKGALYRLLY